MRRTWLAGVLGGAMMMMLSATATVAKPVPATEPAAKAGGARVIATINLSAQNMVVTIDGRVAHTWAISSGTPGQYETPTGSFRPQWAAKMHFSKKYDDAPMPHSVFFNGGIATHGTGSVGRLGSPASHGCIRLAPNNAATFFDVVHQYGFQSVRINVRGTTPSYAVARGRTNDNRLSYADRTQRARLVEVAPYQPRSRRVAATEFRYGGQPRYVVASPQPKFWFGNW